MFNGEDDRSNIKGNKRSGQLTLLKIQNTKKNTKYKIQHSKYKYNPSNIMCNKRSARPVHTPRYLTMQEFVVASPANTEYKYT